MRDMVRWDCSVGMVPLWPLSAEVKGKEKPFVWFRCAFFRLVHIDEVVLLLFLPATEPPCMVGWSG